MREGWKSGAVVALLIGVMSLPMAAWADGPRARAAHDGDDGNWISHVLLISVDGLHQSDLRWFVRSHPESELARLSSGGVQYTRARTPVPSDSFPGVLAQVTGGDPRGTGVYYDAEFNHRLLAPGAVCKVGASSRSAGAPVVYDESIDRDPASIDAGQGLAGLPDGVMYLTSNPGALINPASLPLDPRTCQPIPPHRYLRINTVFEVAKQHGLRTAWADKHPAYDILQGPSGTGIDDLFTPEINSQAFQPNGIAYGGDWTSDNAATRQYDSYKVQAVLNEIDGHDHTGTGPSVGVPAIFGMNFQTISTAEKLPRSEATVGGPQLNGGYLPGTRTPGPLLGDALTWLDGKLATIASEIARRGLARSTAIVLSAKHGQSPQDPTALVRIDDGPILDGINRDWRAKIGDPSAPDLVAASTNDDAIMMWLSDRSPTATGFVARWLMTHPATGDTYNTTDPTQPGPVRTLRSSGLTNVYAGAAAARYFGVPDREPRHPDIWGIVQHGVVYTGGTRKIAEHGGADPEDRHVPLVVYAPRVERPHMVRHHVETTLIAPTILRLLGLDPHDLEAARGRATAELPSM